MRVTIAELLGKVTAKEGEQLEHDLATREREKHHAEETADGRERYKGARRRIEIDVRKRYPED